MSKKSANQQRLEKLEKDVGDVTAPGKMMMRKRREPRVETIDWGKSANSDET